MKDAGDSRNKTRPAKVVVVANSKQKCPVRTHQVPPVTEEKGVAFFSSDHRPSDVAGELLFFFKKGNYFCDVIMIFQPY